MIKLGFTKEQLLTSFDYSPPEVTPQLHPLSLQRLVIAAIMCTSEEAKNVHLTPGNVFQPWVLDQLKTIVDTNYQEH